VAISVRMLGSIIATSDRCGKPECRCHRPCQLSHGPPFPAHL